MLYVCLCWVCLGRIHGQGRVRGHGIVDATGRGVEVTASRGGDTVITVVVVTVTIVVTVTLNVEVVAAASHRDAAVVTRSTTTATDPQTNSRKVVASRQTRMAARLGTTSHRPEMTRVPLMRKRLLTNSLRIMRMGTVRTGEAVPRPSSCELNECYRRVQLPCLLFVFERLTPAVVVIRPMCD